jgi:hypothetical protein
MGTTLGISDLGASRVRKAICMAKERRKGGSAKSVQETFPEFWNLLWRADKEFRPGCPATQRSASSQRPVQGVQTAAQREQCIQLSAVITAQKPGRTSAPNLSVLFALTLHVGLPIEKSFWASLDRPLLNAVDAKVTSMGRIFFLLR